MASAGYLPPLSVSSDQTSSATGQEDTRKDSDTAKKRIPQRKRITPLQED